MIDIISKNPYRFFGVYSNSPIRERVANANKLKAYLKVGKTVSFASDMDCVCPSFVRSQEEFELATANLNLPKDQVKYALFWFINGSPIDKVALDHLQNGNKEKCVEILSKKETYSSLINLAILYAAEENMGNAIANITKVIHNDEYRNEFVKNVAGEEFQIEEMELSTLFIDSLLEYLSLTQVRDLFGKFGDSSDDDELLDLRAVEEPKNIILNAIAEAKEAENTARAQLSAGEKLKKETKSAIMELKNLLGEEDMTYQAIIDKLATQILQNGINYFNKSKDEDEKTIENAYNLQNYALSIAVGKLVKDRCEENVKILEKKKQELPPSGVGFYDKQIKAKIVLHLAGTKNSENAIALVKETAPYLASIKDTLGAQDEYYLRISTLVVSIGLSMVIDEFNSTMSPTLKMQLILNREGTLARLRKVFNNAWDAMLYMSKLDMESDFEKNRFSDQKATLKRQVSELIDVDHYVRLDMKSDDKWYADCKKLADYETYLKIFSKGKHAAQAKQDIERCEYEAIKMTQECQNFLEKYPNTKFPVMEKWEELDFEDMQKNAEGLIQYMKKYPNGKFVKKAKDLLEEEKFWDTCLKSEGKEKYKEYLSKYPNGRHRKEAEKQASACYIATMVYGDYNHPQVVALRGFRDDVLRTNALGRAFISYYYKNSPAWVEKMQEKKIINDIIRNILNLFIKFYNHESK